MRSDITNLQNLRKNAGSRDKEHPNSGVRMSSLAACLGVRIPRAADTMPTMHATAVSLLGNTNPTKPRSTRLYGMRAKPTGKRTHLTGRARTGGDITSLSSSTYMAQQAQAPGSRAPAREETTDDLPAGRVAAKEARTPADAASSASWHVTHRQEARGAQRYAFRSPLL